MRPSRGLTVAYAAARAVGTIPLMPGGLLVVEAVLVPGLVSSGMSLPNAISAMLLYRLISWLLISAIGWVVFFFVFRTENAAGPRRRPAHRAAAKHWLDPEPTGTRCRDRYRPRRSLDGASVPRPPQPVRGRPPASAGHRRRPTGRSAPAPAA